MHGAIECRAGCGACCIALSISSAIPGMPNGKPAGMPCVQLDDELRCRLFGKPERPKVCSAFQAELQFCGETREQALTLMQELEVITRTDSAAIAMPATAMPSAANATGT